MIPLFRIARVEIGIKRMPSSKTSSDRGAICNVAGTIALAGALFTIPADILSWFMTRSYNPLSQTLSALALGDASWLIDTAFWAFFLACSAVGIGMMNLHVSAKSWRLASLAIMSAGAAVFIISIVDGYAGRENTGANIHSWALYALYVLFATAALAASPGLGALAGGVARFSRWAGYVWVVLAPLYYLWFPPALAGILERTLVLIMVVWLVCIGFVLRKEGQVAGRLA